jgi:hypothetical protein
MRITVQIFPVITFELQSLAKSPELAITLGEHVQSSWIYNPWKGHREFSGTVTETGFRISRISVGRNSFRPILFGNHLPVNQGTVIRVSIRWSSGLLVAAGIYFLFCDSFILRAVYWPLLFALLRGDMQEFLGYFSLHFRFFLLIPLAFFLLSYILLRLTFPSEAKAARDELAEILAPLNAVSDVPSSMT